jgi:uncharacterized protein YbbK (DUF523 family)
MIAVRDRPRIGISACLLGDRVRYDGGDKRDAWLVDVLGPSVEWVPVCPEVEAGFGTPREPMELVRDADHGVVLMTNRRRPDLTAALRAFSDRRVRELAALDLDGYVLKAGSPSCAVSTTIAAGRVEPADTVASAGSEGGAATAGRGPGLFADALMRRLPHLAIVDERQLSDPAARQQFVERIFARYARQKAAR